MCNLLFCAFSRVDSRTATLKDDLGGACREGRQLTTRDLQFTNASLGRLEGRVAGIASDISGIASTAQGNATAIAEVKQVAAREPQSLSASINRLEGQMAAVTIDISRILQKLTHSNTTM